MTAPFGGYYTRQEQEDAAVTQISNPNRVGSGFINLGPMTRNAPQQTANWQTGGTAAPPPASMSDIWNAAPPAKPPPPRPTAGGGLAPQMPPPPSSFSQGAGGAFSFFVPLTRRVLLVVPPPIPCGYSSVKKSELRSKSMD